MSDGVFLGQGKDVMDDDGTKPFHLSITNVIPQANTANAMNILAKLILATKIPENHDAIAELWQAQQSTIYTYSPHLLSGEVASVVAHIRRQQRRVEARVARVRAEGDALRGGRSAPPQDDEHDNLHVVG